MEREGSFLASKIEQERQLRVLLDARKLWDGGIGVHTENLIAGLVEQPQVDLTIIAPREIVSAARFARYPWVNKVDVLEDDARSYTCDELFRFAGRIPFNQFDVYHVPHYTLPFGVPIPTVVTVHDLIHIRHPEKIYYPFIAKRLIKSALQRATRVLTVSQATLDELASFVPSRKVRAKLRLVPNALDPHFLRRCEPGDYLMNRFHLHGSYLLSVFSTLKPHKGLRDLLQAFHNMKRSAAATKGAWARACSDLKLVLVGQGTQSPAVIDRLLEHVGATDDVYLYGAVSKEDLLNLYAGARALVIPSVAEGFGLPAIEAQAQGTPVVARPVPALKEILGPSDVACCDFSVPALERGITEVLQKHLRGELVRAAGSQEVMQRFDRYEIARAVLQVYREAVAEAGFEPVNTLGEVMDARRVRA